MPLPQTHLVTTAIGDRPLRVFRATMPITLAVEGVVDQVEIDPVQTALQGVFEPYGFNALAANAPVVAQRSPSGTAVLITLDQPLPVTSVRLSSSTPVAANYTLAFHRVDGTAVVEKPTAIASIQTRLATLTTEFIDGRFAVQLRDATGNSVALSTAHLLEINLQSYPTTPRLGILDERVPPASLLPVWQAPGEIGRATPSTQGNVDAGAALATTLQRYLNAHPDLLNTSLKLIAESDAPCQFRLNTLSLMPQFVVQRFPVSDNSQPPPPKQVLRFTGKAAATQTLHIQLPAHSHITAATLELAESLRPQTVNATEADGLPALPILTTPTGTEGICAQVDRALTQQVAIPLATRVNGMALGVMAIANHTTLHLALYADHEGRPAGQPVAESDLTPTPVGQPTWAIASFPKPVVLFAQPYWIMLNATKGSALWLTQPGQGTVQIVDNPMQFQLGQAMNALNALAGLYHWLSPADATPSPSEQSASDPVSSLQVWVGGQSIQGTMTNGKRRYDLPTSLNQLVSSLAVAPSERLISMVFSTTSTGSITVYPPQIRFIADIPS